MSTVTTPTRHTPEDLLRMPDGGRFELVDGELVERPMSYLSNYVAGNLYYSLRSFCDAEERGWVAPSEVGFQCFPDAPSKVRRADVSFIRLERLSLSEAQEEGHLTIAPDLAVEVLSPNELAYDIDEKVGEYLAAGVCLVWVVNPAGRSVAIHRKTGPGTILREHDELTGEDVLPGFRCRVADLFRLPTSTPAPTP